MLPRKMGKRRMIKQSFLTKNDCYIYNQKRNDKRYATFQDRGPVGLMLHSVGCSQPSAKSFVDKWNKSGISKCVHGFIDANTGDVYQTLPWNYRGWHAGGKANDTHIGVEMCEPNCIQYTSGAKFVCTDKAKAQAMVGTTYDAAVELFAMICQEYHLDPMKDILSHSEGYKQGIASGHSDPEHLWRGLGLPYTMATFRDAVSKRMKGIDPVASPEPQQSASDSYKVKILTGTLNVRKGPSTKYDINTVVRYGEVYTIVEESADKKWGKLKSGAGWINLAYTTRV